MSTKLPELTDVAIIGSGPAGWTAAIYASRNKLNTLVITGKEIGGQLTLTTTIENFPGFEDPMGGKELMERMRKQAVLYGTQVIEEHVVNVDFSQNPFTLETDKGNQIKAKSVIISTGSYAKWLNIESEEKFKGYGVSGCAVCDGFFFKNQKVGIVGGGNTAIEEALHMAKIASSVDMFVRSDSLKGEGILIDQIKKEDKINIHYNTQLNEILGVEEDGDKYVNGAIIKNNKTNEEIKFDLDGIFVAIGHSPNSIIFRDKIEIDNFGYILTKPDSTQTNIKGVFAAGDVQDRKYKQAVTSAGTGCMAALEATEYLSRL